MPASDLVDIATACSRRGVLDTVGVVVDKLDVYRTRGSSWCITFTIKDEDFDGPTWMGGLKIKYFNDNSNVLPEVRLGDVVLLRGIRVGLRPIHTSRIRSSPMIGQHVPRQTYRCGLTA